MPNGLVPLLAGAMGLVAILWWLPREMERIRDIDAEQGKGMKVDAMLRSRPYRLGVALGVFGGVLAVAIGMIELLS